MKSYKFIKPNGTEIDVNERCVEAALARGWKREEEKKPRKRKAKPDIKPDTSK